MRLSMMATLGSSERPAASRSTARRSLARASKQPAASQRWLCWNTAAHRRRRSPGGKNGEAVPSGRYVGHPAPRGAGLDDVAQTIEYFAQRMLTLAGILGQQRPFFIGDIGRIRLTGRIHTQGLGDCYPIGP